MIDKQAGAFNMQLTGRAGEGCVCNEQGRDLHAARDGWTYSRSRGDVSKPRDMVRAANRRSAVGTGLDRDRTETASHNVHGTSTNSLVPLSCAGASTSVGL